MQLRIVATLVIALCGFLSNQCCVAAQQNEPKPHLYFFTSSNCEPCRQVKPEIQRLVDNHYPVTTIDVDRKPEVARQFGVDRWPTTILVFDGQMVQRKSGLIDAPTMAGWFQSLRRKTAAPVRAPQANPAKLAPDGSNGLDEQLQAFESSTIHRGTRTPENDAEFNAMRATVRIKVEDPKGESFATGTVIHCDNGKCLVMTCGHVFRESQGRGKITAEYGFETKKLKTAPGTLVQYDAGPRDIALITIQTDENISAVQVAPLKFPIARGDQVFSIGCDHGKDATIRRTRIKNQALYDQAKKYDIYGRPVDGRSGGGLFTAGGQLIGVCNAAAVEVDEGIYTSLENVYWQMASANLEHLLLPKSNLNSALVSEGQSQPNARTPRPPSLAQRPPAPDSQALRDHRAFPPGAPLTPPRRPRINQVSQDKAAASPIAIPDSQIIVVIQSKSNPDQAETLVIDQPSEPLLQQLQAESQSLASENATDQFARLRGSMPSLAQPRGRSFEEVRGQSLR